MELHECRIIARCALQMLVGQRHFSGKLVMRRNHTQKENAGEAFFCCEVVANALILMRTENGQCLILMPSLIGDKWVTSTHQHHILPSLRHALAP